MNISLYIYLYNYNLYKFYKMKTTENTQNTQNTKNTNKFETRAYWNANKNRLIDKNGAKGIWFYTCKKDGCKLPRCLNEKKDPEYESSIKSDFCSMHKKQLLEKAAPKL